MTATTFQTRFTAMLGIEHPVANAGMGYYARAPLAAAVSNAGGLGTLGSAWPPEQLAAMVEETRSLTSGPIAINIIPELQGDGIVQTAIDLGFDVIVSGWADPAPIVEAAHAAGIKVMHRCVNEREAAECAEAGVDILLAQGSDAGGHTGEIPGLGLLPAVVDAANGTPVVYAGGIGDGRGLVAALALGADGVILGTRFVASAEAAVHDVYKSKLLDACSADSIESNIFGQREWPDAPTRALRNSTIRDYEAEPEPRTPILERPLEIIGRRRLNDEVEEIPRYWLSAPAPEDEGDIEAMALYAGTSAGVVNEILPAGEIVDRVMREARAARERLERLGNAVR